jgi:general secretion pathway protein H
MMRSAIGNSGRSSDGGFALVELLVVIAIAALLAVIAIKQSPGTRTRLELQATANTIVGDLTRARFEAIDRGAVNEVEFDTAQRNYGTAFGGVTRTLPAKIRLEIAQPISSNRVGQRPRLLFFPDGTATAGRILLISDDRRIAIDVNWLTGRAIAHD